MTRAPAVIAGVLIGSVLTAAAGAWLAIERPSAARGLEKAVMTRLAWLRGADGGAGPNLDSVVVQVDAAGPGHPISPLVYGVSVAEPDVLRALGATADRWGGNPSSRYNWVNGHAWNSARDWEFRNGNYGKPAGSVADSFVAASLDAQSVPIMTVPTLGWVARDDSNSSQSLEVPAGGGPPLRPGAAAIAGYDPSRNRASTSVASLARKPGPLQDPPDSRAATVYQDEWVHHLAGTFGAGKVRYFAMDNEPDLWSSTHTDVHPTQMGYDDMLANFEEYATAVKAQAPSAKVLGPDVSGWTSYLYSDLDRGSDSFATHADRRRHGDVEFVPWWLGQVARADATRGSRTLDLLDVHYYPQAGGVYSAAADPATRGLRIRATRSLWDPSYQDESWIGTEVTLIPRLKQWVASAYPGTGLAITEYNFGGERDASGAVALAEALGIFGREGVDIASYWTYPAPDSPAGAAFRLYRNFDGKGGAFGDLSLAATSNQRQVAAFASRHSSGGEVDVVLANESQARTASVRLDLVRGGSYRSSLLCIAPGSARIEAVPMATAQAPVKLAPLSVCLLRLMPS